MLFGDAPRACWVLVCKMKQGAGFRTQWHQCEGCMWGVELSSRGRVDYSPPE